MKQFEEEVRNKMSSLKNKKVKTTDIDQYYADVQKKMKELEKVMQIAFVELKARSEADSGAELGKSLTRTIKNPSSSSISASG